MDIIDLGLIAAVGILCGLVGQLTSRHSRGGWIVNLGVGIIGSAVGAYLARQYDAPDIFNLKTGATNFPIIYALIGSVLAVGIISYFVNSGRR